MGLSCFHLKNNQPTKKMKTRQKKTRLSLLLGVVLANALASGWSQAGKAEIEQVLQAEGEKMVNSDPRYQIFTTSINGKNNRGLIILKSKYGFFSDKLCIYDLALLKGNLEASNIGRFWVRERWREHWRKATGEDKKRYMAEYEFGLLEGFKGEGDEFWFPKEIRKNKSYKTLSEDEAKAHLKKLRESKEPADIEVLAKANQIITAHMDEMRRDKFLKSHPIVCGWLDENRIVLWKDSIPADPRTLLHGKVIILDCKEKTVTIPFLQYDKKARDWIKKMTPRERERRYHLLEETPGGKLVEGKEIPCGFKLVFSNESVPAEAKALVRAKIKSLIAAEKLEEDRERLRDEVKEIMKRPAAQRPF